MADEGGISAAEAIARRLVRRARGARSMPVGVRARYLMDPLARRAPGVFVRLTARRLGFDPGAFYASFREGAGSETARELEARGALTASGQTGISAGALLYALVRTLTPPLVLETGVANGLSSAYLLAALEANRQGRLISIDLPFGGDEETGPVAFVPGASIERAQWSPIPPGREPGWLVPERLRERWTLLIGDARELLPQTLARGDSVGLFFHDSLHTEEHMLFEFRAVWPHLQAGGVLVSDDIYQPENYALQRLAAGEGRPYAVFAAKGLVRKPPYA